MTSHSVTGAAVERCWQAATKMKTRAQMTPDWRLQAFLTVHRHLQAFEAAYLAVSVGSL